MWIRDHVDVDDIVTCPYCGHEATLMDFAHNPCVNCEVKMSFKEWSAEIDRASLTWVKDDVKVPSGIIVSDNEVQRILGRINKC